MSRWTIPRSCAASSPRAAWRVQSTARATFIGPPDSYAPPPDLQLRRLAESLAPPRPRESATVRVRAGTAAPLRRRASRSRPVDDGWTELELAYASGQTLADELLSYGPDVVVVAPTEVRDSVVRQLSALAVATP